MRTLSGSQGSTARRLSLLALLAAAVLAPACVPQEPGARGPYPAFAEYEGDEVRRVTFMGELELPVDSLREVIVTRPTRCWLILLPVCLPFTNVGRDVYELDLDELSRDVLRLQLYYRDHGYYGTAIAPSVDAIGEGDVAVRFAIAPGDQVFLTELEVAGTEGIVEPEDLEALLPLKPGEPFGRRDFLRSADTIRTELLSRGHAFAEVLRNYSLDTIADVAQAQFIAIPGPVVELDTILFLGVGRLSERTLRRQMALREGDLLQVPQLARSQRNLHDLRMVNFASVEIAPDSLQRDADSTTATVLARVVEAPQYVVDAAGGIGTVDCVRAEGRWVDRNFLGGGRMMEVSGLLSRIGVGEPLNLGLGQSLCAGATRQPLGVRSDILGQLNFRAAANFQQPRLLATRTELNISAHAERLTELNAYMRESLGGQVALSRQVGEDRLLNTTLGIDHGRTLANPVILCIGFDICSAPDVEELQRFRWANALAVTTIWDRTRTELASTRGFSTRASVEWASRVLLSDNEYLRILAEGSVYRPLRPGWILAGNLRLGSFLQGRLLPEAGYIPPERRFYAGGPNSVRGLPRNALGPTAYVWTERETRRGFEQDTVRSAVGGTQMVVASTELRMPSPVFSRNFRLAAFVDAGQVWAPGSEVYGITNLVVTPGMGLRVATPVGPMRLDVAYNGYPLPTGPLYFVEPVSGDLLLVEHEHRPPGDRSFLQRLEFSFAVGQAF